MKKNVCIRVPTLSPGEPAWSPLVSGDIVGTIHRFPPGPCHLGSRILTLLLSLLANCFPAELDALVRTELSRVWVWGGSASLGPPTHAGACGGLPSTRREGPLGAQPLIPWIVLFPHPSKINPEQRRMEPTSGRGGGTPVCCGHPLQQGHGAHVVPPGEAHRDSPGARVQGGKGAEW